MKNNSLSDLSKLGIQNFGFLIEPNSRITTREFADRIRSYSTDGRSIEVAFNLECISGIIRRDHFGSKYYPESAENRAEIAVRNLGWTTEAISHGEYNRYKVVAKEPSADGIRRQVDGEYDFEYQAYDAAAKALNLRLRHDKPELPHDAHVDAVFDLMRAVVEAPDAMLQHYKNDFYEHDRNAIHAFAGLGKFIWVVKQTSTQLAPVGISAASSGFVEAAMNSGGGTPYEVYVIDGDKLTINKINRDKALDILKHRDYEIKGDSVIKNGKLLASMAVELQSRVAEMPVGVVRVELADDGFAKVRDLIALREIAIRKVTEKSGSFFTPTREIVVGSDRQPITEMIDLARGFDEVSQSCFYGEIKCDQKDSAILESLGVDLGRYDAKSKTFLAAVPASSLSDLEAYQASFELNLISLPFSVKPQSAIASVVSADQMSDLERVAYGMYLNFAMSRALSDEKNEVAMKYEGPLLGAEMRALMDANAAAQALKMSTRKPAGADATLQIA